MKTIKKTVMFLLVLCIMTGLFSSIGVIAKEIILPVPKIKVKLNSNGTSATIIICKTKDADGYEIFSDYIWDRNDIAPVDMVSDKPIEWQCIAKLEHDGKKKRTYKLNTLQVGKNRIKVRSYNEKKYGALRYSEFSKVKTVKAKAKVNGYKDKYDFSKVKKGDTILFGSYEQDFNFSNGKEPIEWVVLSKNSKEIFVVSKYSLDYLDSLNCNNFLERPYKFEKDYPDRNTWDSKTWEYSLIRKWLNNSFYENAFNESEKKLIKQSIVENYDNAIDDASGGNDTKDKVFLLSHLEVIDSDYGFSEEYEKEDEARKAPVTMFAREHYILYENSSFYDEYYQEKYGGNRYWLLRTTTSYNSGSDITFEAVSPNGDIKMGYYYADEIFIRPAMRISL